MHKKKAYYIWVNEDDAFQFWFETWNGDPLHSIDGMYQLDMVQQNELDQLKIVYDCVPATIEELTRVKLLKQSNNN